MARNYLVALFVYSNMSIAILVVAEPVCRHYYEVSLIIAQAAQ